MVLLNRRDKKNKEEKKDEEERLEEEEKRAAEAAQKAASDLAEKEEQARLQLAEQERILAEQNRLEQARIKQQEQARLSQANTFPTAKLDTVAGETFKTADFEGGTQGIQGQGATDLQQGSSQVLDQSEESDQIIVDPADETLFTNWNENKAGTQSLSASSMSQKNSMTTAIIAVVLVAFVILIGSAIYIFRKRLRGKKQPSSPFFGPASVEPLVLPKDWDDSKPFTVYPAPDSPAFGDAPVDPRQSIAAKFPRIFALNRGSAKQADPRTSLYTVNEQQDERRGTGIESELSWSDMRTSMADEGDAQGGVNMDSARKSRMKSEAVSAYRWSVRDSVGV
jgi:hypothetical protein